MKFLAVLVLSTLSLPAMSQTCYVDMIVKNTGRVVQTFIGYGDSTCLEGMKECRKSIRLDYSSNREYPNGSLDCVSARRNPGGQNPYPGNPGGQNPYPGNPGGQNPYPGNPGGQNPYPGNPGGQNPYPNPYYSVNAAVLMLDMAGSNYNSEVQTKMLETMISNINSYQLSQLARICASTRTYQENASCLIDGIRRGQQELVDESVAIFSVGRACVQTKTWQDEKSCFSAAIRNNRLPSLQYYAQSCNNMYNAESSAQCFRSVFNVR
jgi:hypothetical protein